MADTKTIELGTVGTHVGRHGRNNDIVASIGIVLPALRGSACAQIFTHGPQSMNRAKFDPDTLRACAKKYRIYAHSTYRTSWNKNLYHLKDQLQTAGELGLMGVVVHLGKLSPADHIATLDRLNIPQGTRVYLEMRALRRDRWTYQTPGEINELCAALHAARYTPAQVAICLDSAHINAGNISLRTIDDAAEYMNALKYPQYVQLLHLNGNAYDPEVRAGDKHCTPLSAQDYVFKEPLAESGCVALARWFTSRGHDVILEQAYDNELVKFYNRLIQQI